MIQSNILLTDVDIPVFDNLIPTEISLNTNSPCNNDILPIYETIDNIPVITPGNGSVFPDNPADLPKIETLSELLNYLSELMMRFNSSPRYYLQDDFALLIKTITNSLIYLYLEGGSTDNIEIPFIGVASLVTDPIADSLAMGNLYPGIYLVNGSGNYINFGVTITDEQRLSSIILLVPIITNGDFVSYTAQISSLNIPIITPELISAQLDQFTETTPTLEDEVILGGGKKATVEEILALADTPPAQVQSDLSQEDDTQPDFVKGKEIIPVIDPNTVIDANYVHTDNNFTDDEKDKVDSAEQSSNKQNSLATDSTNLKYATVTAVNLGLAGIDQSKWEQIPSITQNNGIKYGRLYNWYAATDVRDIAPVGWHVPSVDEFNTLIAYLGGGHLAGLALSDVSLGNGSNNSSGFSNLSGGGLCNYNTFYALGATGFYYTTTEYYQYQYFCKIQTLANSEDNAYTYPNQDWDMGGEASIRLIKDNSTNEGDVIIDGDTYNAVTIGTQVWLQQNLAVTHYQNGDPIGSDFSDTVGAVCAYNNDETNVYDIVTVEDLTHIQPKDGKKIHASIIDDLPSQTDNNYTNADKTIVESIPSQTETFTTDIEGLNSGKVDKVTGSSLVPDTEIAKIHIQNTDYTLLSPDGTKSASLDNAGVLTVQQIAYTGNPVVVHAQEVYSTNDQIILRDGAVSGLANGAYAGFTAKLYDGVHDGQLVFDNLGFARVGDVGSLLKLAAIQETPTDTQFTYYDAATYSLKTRAFSSGDITGALGFTPLATRTFGTAANNNTGDFEVPLTFSTGLTRTGNTITNNITQYTNSMAVAAQSTAGTSTTGLLSSTDWNTFNGKQTSLGFTPANIANKQNSLVVDGTGVKYPTVDAINGAGFIPYIGNTNNINLGVHNLVIDANTFVIDSVNHRVGCQMTTPLHMIDLTTTQNQRTVYGLNIVMNATNLQQDIASTGNDEPLLNQYYAWKFTASAANTMGSLSVRLKKIGTVTNTTDYVRLKLYSDTGTAPNALLYTSDQVKMGTLTTSYVEYLFGGDYTMVNGTSYWLVVERSASVTGGGSITVDRNSNSLSTTNVVTPASGDWTINTGLGRYIIYGQTPRGIYVTSTNYVGVYGSSTNSYGVQGISTNSGGVYGISTNSYGVYGNSTNSTGVNGNSTNSYGVQGISTNSAGVNGNSTNNYGVYGQSSSSYGLGGISTTGVGFIGISTNSSGGAMYIGDGVDKLTQNNTGSVLIMSRRVDGNSTYAVSGNLLNITDNPTNCTSVSGALISGTIVSTERFRIDPRVVDGSTAVGAFTDTLNALSNSTAKLFSFRNNGVEKAYINANGSFISTSVSMPVQAPTASAPPYIKGGLYFDTTLNKLRVGGATAWETITSV